MCDCHFRILCAICTEVKNIFLTPFDILGLYLKISAFLEEYFDNKGIESDIFYIDTSMEAPIYCAPLESKVQFTDYYPEKLTKFYDACQSKLEENKGRMAG